MFRVGALARVGSKVVASPTDERTGTYSPVPLGEVYWRQGAPKYTTGVQVCKELEGSRTIGKSPRVKAEGTPAGHFYYPAFTYLPAAGVRRGDLSSRVRYYLPVPVAQTTNTVSVTMNHYDDDNAIGVFLPPHPRPVPAGLPFPHVTIQTAQALRRARDLLTMVVVL